MKIRAFWLVFEGGGPKFVPSEDSTGLRDGRCGCHKGPATTPKLTLLLLQEIFDGPWTSRAFRANFGWVCRVDHIRHVSFCLLVGVSNGDNLHSNARSAHRRLP